MIAILLLALLQDQPVEATIDAFLKGDAASRGKLMNLGAYAIRPLQKAREKSPEKIDALVFELKMAVAHPKDCLATAQLGNKVRSVHDVDLREASFGKILERMGPQVFLDRFAPGDVKTTKISIKVEDRPIREIFDQICAQTGLDYGIFHNTVVIGKPERLWPAGPPPAPRPLTAGEAARARDLVEKLNADSIEAREAATGELIKIGVPVLPVLEANLARKEGEIAARCAALARRLRKAPRGAFGPSGFERQERSERDEEIFERLRERRVTFKVRDISFSGVQGILSEWAEVPVRMPLEWKDRKASILFDKLSVLDILSLITQSNDLDFVLRDGAFEIDKRDAVDEFILSR